MLSLIRFGLRRYEMKLLHIITIPMIVSFVMFGYISRDFFVVDGWHIGELIVLVVYTIMSWFIFKKLGVDS